MRRNLIMPTSRNDLKEQFEAVEDLLTRWLKERRALLGKYTEIAVTLDQASDTGSLLQKQNALCELLVDYASVGHFEVFHELVNEAERFDDGGCKLAEKILPDIGATTEVMLAYEEKYGEFSGHPENLKRDLSALGEVLESRFVLEDQLIAGLHNRHRRQVRTPTPRSA
jgi:regulator of sigma D